ncbi:MAG: aminotransferase class I/II-fold pyridoxal phosphate-dependent enzyme [Thermoprotei archaeon]
MIILSRNECPYPPSPLVRESVCRDLERINRYEIPGLVDEIRRLLASYTGAPVDYIHLLSGSEAFFVSLPWAFLRYNYKFVYLSPTFAPAIEDLSIWGVKLADIPLDNNFRINIEKVLEESGSDSIIYIVNPNNPTGNEVIACDDVEKLARYYRAVILDEAYYEYSGLTCKNLVLEYDNVMVLRTLSKAFCLAGARIAYLIAHPNTYREFFGTRRKYDIPVPSLLAARGALQDLDYMRKVVSKTLSTKKWVVEELRKIEDIEVVDTLTNFILVGKRGYDSKTLAKKLLENNILVKELDGRLGKYVRVTIGAENEMKYFINVIKTI